MLRSGDLGKDAREIAGKLDISSGDITKDSICIQCHATPQVDHTGSQRVIAGVSCEMCHGASGGEDGWLNLHAVYGPAGTQRETESPEHFQMRSKHCTQAGQNRVSNAFRLARACFQCHLVWHEDLVNVGGHPAGDDLEFVAWSLGEVRHNFHLVPNVNALVSTLWTDPLWRPDGREGKVDERVRIMYVAGQLAKLHVALVNRATATDPNGDFASGMDDYIGDAQGDLEGIIIEYSEDDEDEEKEYDEDDLPSLQRAVNTVTNTLEAVDEIDEPDTAIGKQEIAALFRKAAVEVEAAAEQFMERHDGSDLEVVDGFAPELAALEEQDEGVVKGRAWEP